VRYNVNQVRAQDAARYNQQQRTAQPEEVEFRGRTYDSTTKKWVRVPVKVDEDGFVSFRFYASSYTQVYIDMYVKFTHMIVLTN
jgi:hypothetical protein